MYLRLLGLLLLISLSGCTYLLPVYEPSVNDHAFTTINVSHLMRPKACIDGKWYRLKKDDEGNAPIPTGKRITLANIFFQEKNEAYEDLYFSCENSLSFDSKSNQTYYANFDIQDKQCHIEVLALEPKRAVGVSLIPVYEAEC
jgi:hypothetical protein